jgi:hypothetical protein
MRMKLARVIAEIVLGLLGTAMLVIAIFSYQLHIDNNQSMGPNRVALACLGAIFLLTGIIIYSAAFLKHIWKSPVFQKTRPLFNRIGSPYFWLIKTIQEDPGPQRASHATGWFATAGAALAIFISLWYITSGRMVTWTTSTNYLDRQANAFLAGQIPLLEKPPAALVALANPYQYQNRAGISGYIWDASLYKGKYYFYWGPVPALLVSAVKIFHPAWDIQDQFTIFFSIAGLAIVLAALFYRLQKKYFPGMPGWVVLGLTLLGALNMPVFWLLNNPIVHAAAISTGQFFLILGLLTAMLGLENKKYQVFLMAMTGFSWGAAIGSRVDLAPGIAWMVLLVCLFLLFKAKKWHPSTSALIALILPLVFWGAGLAWYNYARFGNILETGHRYQLTGGALPADYRNIVSPSYILPNLYELLARPMEINWHEFPFLFTPFIRNTMWPKLFFYPRNLNYFYGEPITGLLISMPVIWLTLFTGLLVLIKYVRSRQREPAGLDRSLQEPSFYPWISWMVSGAIILNFGTLSIFIFSTMRYEADLAPLLTILVGLCVGWASTTFHFRPRLWRTILLFVGATILISIIISLLANFQNGDYIFMNSNPHLYQAIAHFFTGR